jgi:hypothetical protein
VIEAKLGSKERLKWGQSIIEKGFTGLILFSLTIFEAHLHLYSCNAVKYLFVIKS